MSARRTCRTAGSSLFVVSLKTRAQMQDLVRREVIETAITVVVKIGTNVLSRDDGSLDTSRVTSLAEQIYGIRSTGRKVLVVSSGAVGAGMRLLGLTSRPTDLPHLQAAAATGQVHLIHLYDECLRRHGCHAAQLLVTGNDFRNRVRYLNARNTLRTLIEYNVIPIVNENDTVSIDEIRFGDNDQLAAMVCNMLTSPLLVILTAVDGLYDGDPALPESHVIPLIESWDDSVLELAAPEQSSHGTGGMHAKLRAVQAATAVGENVIIANGRQPRILDDILAGRVVGTLFLANGAAMPAWKRWIGYTMTPRGKIAVDDGATRAVREQGKSLLAIGITAVDGNFAQGDVVALVDPLGREFARGLTNYASRDAHAIAGKRSNEIEIILGHLQYSELIHRDNLVLTD